MEKLSLPFPFVCAPVNQDELDRHIIIVSIIGDIDINHTKQLPLGIVPGLENPLQIDPLWDMPPIMCGYDNKERVLYLHFRGVTDPQAFPKLMDLFNENDSDECFLTKWDQFNNYRAKLLLLLFSVSHIVTLCYTSTFLSTSQIQMLKVMSYLRAKYQNLISKLLSKSDLFSELWSHHGRFCAPRLLFVFNGKGLNFGGNNNKRMAKVKRLEHALEDQLYFILKKCRLVKNISTRAAFSIAPNDEFVYVSIPDDEALNKRVEMLQLLFEDCAKSRKRSLAPDDPLNEGVDGENDGNEEHGNLHPSCSSSEADDMDFLFGPKTCHSFLTFLMNHIGTAHKEGFYDNIGKYQNSKPYFELPTFREWIRVVTLIVSDEQVGIKGFDPDLQRCLDKCISTEIKFGCARCKKVLPLAQSIYQEGLPPHYDQATHQRKLDHAVSVFTSHARGPKQSIYIAQLILECEKYWRSGRQTCPVLSLFKNSCAKPVHGSVIHCGLACESDHWNGVRFISACNCGLSQGQRTDPFTVKSANMDFYQLIGKECGCYHFDAAKFPVFQPSSHNPIPAHLPQTMGKNMFAPGVDKTAVSLYNQKSGGESQLQSVADRFERLWSTDDDTPMTTDDDSFSLSYYGNQSYMDTPLHIDPSKEIKFIRQPSTTEYLPSMLHTESPPGILPLFSSWSLICKGPSSLYSHNIGLSDQPGFFVGSGYLLPWDVYVRPSDLTWAPLTEENTEKLDDGHGEHIKPTKNYLRGSKDVIIVKIFVGIEYECMRGHRFMSSSPGSILQASEDGIVKENAAKITKGNMPLFLPCPCGKQTAQIMRIHVVTPKAPVIVTIDPRVRPAPPPCPTFIPSFQSAIPLSQSAYSVLRLPFVYASENSFYTVPHTVRKLNQGELIGPMFGIRHVPDST